MKWNWSILLSILKKNRVCLFLIFLFSFIGAVSIQCFVVGINNQVANPLWLLTHISKKWIIACWCILILVSLICKFTKFLQYIHKYRHLVCCALLIVFVCLDINGSSIGQWINVFNSNGQYTEGNLVGVSRSIRSDEYNIFTPLALSQEYNDYGFTSELPRAEETNMFIVHGQPVKDISIIFRPFQIGYLFLGSSYGLSFYWMSRLIFLFVFSYDFMLLICKRRRLISFTGAIVITFAPAIQWWFSINCYVEMFIAVELSVVLFDKYMLSNHTLIRAGYSAGIMLCAGMFIFSLYPAVMVPLAYVLLGIIIWVFFKNRHSCKYSIKDLLVTLLVVIVFSVLIIRALCMSIDSIKAVSETVYPGTRNYLGGGLKLSSLTDYIFNLLLPFNNKFVLTNASEDARFIDLFPLSYILILLLLIFKKKDQKLSLLIKILLPINLFFILVATAPFSLPSWFMKITLLYQATRLIYGIQFSNVILLFHILPKYINVSKSKSYKFKITLSITVFVIWTFVILFIRKSNLTNFGLLFANQSSSVIVCSIICGIVISLALLIRENNFIFKFWAGITISVVVISGGLVNPVRKGVGVIKEQDISLAIQKISAEDYDAKWIYNGSFFGGNFLMANGAKTLNSYNAFPALIRWDSINKDNYWSNYEIYNRCASLGIKYDSNITDNKFTLQADDCFNVTINKDGLRILGVKYIVSHKDSATDIEADQDFETIYENNQSKIYKLK